MFTITLPDGSSRQFESPDTVNAIAKKIGSKLAKSAVAGRVDGHLVDTNHLIDSDVRLEIITHQDETGLEVIRHSCAHLLAQAVKSLFPDAQVTIGPVIENGFYYDFAYQRAFTPDDLRKIEVKMQQLVKKNLPVRREEMGKEAAIALFHSLGEHYKVEIINEIPDGETLTVYHQGDFVDLCRGPHVPRLGVLKAFKLTKLAGAYWRGDSNNVMLQRIYGTAWADKDALNHYLKQLEEAEKRDHRLLAKKMDLYHLQDEAPGLVFWHPNGWRIVTVLRDYIRTLQGEQGYQEINTPQLVDERLWEQSGHKAKFGDDMFSIESGSREYVIKPMSCPCHVQVFKQGLKSYRDLPVRFSEFGCCHRNEPSGTLHGLMRLRGFVQDDGHIFCTEEQIQDEVSAFIDSLHRVYQDLGFTDIIYKLSTRPEKRIGSEATWDRAESALAQALDSQSVDWDYLSGEGAFYGPKIEFSLRDCLGRVWQCGTIQVDFSMPERLGAHYVADSGDKTPPVMLHRAVLGSFERFIAILLEHYEGRLPLWLAPEQVAIMNISDKQSKYATEIAEKLKKRAFRVQLDLRNEKIGYKIREHTLARVPYLVIVGDNEVESHAVSVRMRSGETQSWCLDEFVHRLETQRTNKE